MYRLLIASSLIFILALGSACATTGSSDTQTRQARLSTIVLSASMEEDGESVNLVLTNGTEQLMGANMCTINLEVREGEDWAPKPLEFDRECEDNHKSISPGSSRKATYRSESLASIEDEYRFVIKVEYPMGLGFETIASASSTPDEVEVATETDALEEAEETEETEDSEETDTVEETDAVEETEETEDSEETDAVEETE